MPTDHEVAADVATRAGEVLLRLRADAGVSSYERWNLRDDGDYTAHHFIFDELSRLRPGDKILSEEGVEDRTRLGGEGGWFAAPPDGPRESGELDGGDGAVHVALVDGTGAPIAGAVALPAVGITLCPAPAPPHPPAREGRL